MNDQIEQARAVEQCLRLNFNGAYMQQAVPDIIASLITELEAARKDAALIGSACDKLRLMHSAEIKAWSGIHRAELEAARKDAARYRALMNNCRSKYIWNNVFTDDQRELGSSVESVLDALAAGGTK